MKAPYGWDEVLKFYGDIRQYVRPDGTLRPEWERHELVIVDLPGQIPLSWDPAVKVSRIRCHRKLGEIAEATFQSIKAAGLWNELREYGGCFEYRKQRGGGKLSLHAFGAALDLNPSTNRLGEEGDMPPEIVAIFEANGWTWGGRWVRPDFMHFQFAQGV